MKKASSANKAQTVAAQWHAQALLRHKAGQLQAAEPLYRQALKAAPDFADSLHMLGVLCAQSGRHAEACELIAAALQQTPGDVLALGNLGGVLNQLHRHAEALDCFERLLAREPANADAHTSRADALRGLGRFAESLAASEAALNCRPGLLRASIARANALRRLVRFDEALAALDAVLAAAPNSPEAHNDRGNVLFDLRRFDAALAAFEAALALRPGYVEAQFNRANTLRAAQHWSEAVAAYDALLAAQPAHAEAWNNRGAALEMAGDFAAALASYAQARAAQPEHVMAHLNAGLCHLLRGELEAGWPLYRWRERCADAALANRALPAAPRWDGVAPLAGRRVLLAAEQGLGDTLQFCRHAAEFAARGAQVLLETWPGLQALAARVPGVQQVVVAGEALPEVDYWLPLLDAPALLGARLEALPACVRYLAPLPERVAHWQAQLAARCAPGRRRIGLVWSGNPRHSNDHHRSIALSRLAPLFAREDLQFVSLQPELRAADEAALAAAANLLDLRGELRDFDDTAAILAGLERVICVDTSVAHLAGALGVPTWLLLPAKPDWRWLLERADSPWYPSLRLFRQPAHGDWDAVLGEVLAALDAPGAAA